LPKQLSPSPLKPNHFDTIEGKRLHADPRFLDEQHDRNGLKFDSLSHQQEGPKAMGMSFQEEFDDYDGIEEEEEQMGDNSALLDESLFNKCFDIPDIDKQDKFKNIKELQNDVGYVPPTLKPALLQELKENA